MKKVGVNIGTQNNITNNVQKNCMQTLFHEIVDESKK